MSNLIVLSYITEPKVSSDNLERSLVKYGYQYQFLGAGCRWKGFISSKIQCILDFCLEHEQYDFICIIDGYDVLASGPVLELIRKYKTFNTDIVYGGEKTNLLNHCHTDTIKYHDLSPIKYRKYINGGFCIGKRHSLIKLYQWIIQKSSEIHTEDDQKILGMYMNRYPSRISVDISSKIVFNTISFIDTLNFHERKNRIHIKSTDTQPCFIHFPSNKSDMYMRDNAYGASILKKDYIKLRCVGNHISKQFVFLILFICLSVYVAVKLVISGLNYTKKLLKCKN